MWHLLAAFGERGQDSGTGLWTLVQSSCFGALLTVLCWNLAVLGWAEKCLPGLCNFLACQCLPDVLDWDFVTQCHDFGVFLGAQGCKSS